MKSLARFGIGLVVISVGAAIVWLASAATLDASRDVRRGAIAIVVVFTFIAVKAVDLAVLEILERRERDRERAARARRDGLTK
ncbi:MAG: hypothetical protein K2Q20_12340 [Phycisphaerales bacterium]|nr:hypothetical protein [Phycisphaerales bacterium]